jgi:uncharacterized membrane protein
METGDDEQMQRQLGGVLRIGVIAAAALVLLGLVLNFTGSDRDRASLDTALGRQGSIHALHPAGIVAGLRDGEASAFIQTGLLVLILTPIARVALTFVLFQRRRDWPFVALSGVVLIVLILGLFGIGA